MYHPAHIDGCTVVVLRPHGLGYAAVESGWLSFDGVELALVTDDTRRTLSDGEVDLLKLVVPGNRIASCQGFDFFLIRPE